MATREYYDEINALVGALAKALHIDEKQVATELEDGTIALQMGEDDNGNRFVEATRAGSTARVYQGAIVHAEDGSDEA